MAKLDRWNPLTPLAAALLVVAAAYVGPAPWAPGAALAVSLAAAWWAGLARRVGALAAAVAIPTFALLALTNGVLAAATRWDPSAVQDALDVALRLGAAVAALATVVSGVAPRRLTRALSARGLPGWAAYLLVASLEAAPEARERARQVLDAQRCRGFAPGKGIAGRLRAILPLAGPLVSAMVVESDERALALDARGFRAGRARTALTAVADPAPERFARRIIWLALLAVLFWGLVR